jgi:LmbE family N-acetylglucosaminyl deacetylase
MRVLYIFPHPDDESFGPALTMNLQRRQGHEVYLLTLTKGGATKIRHELGKTVDEMGAIREAEMQDVAKVLNLSGMTVLNFEDSGLAEANPVNLEAAVYAHIEQVKPDVVVTYPVHGISHFDDHLVTHAIVKRVFVEMKEQHRYLKRLAFFTLGGDLSAVQEKNPFYIKGSPEQRIDCIVNVEDEDIEAMRKSLNCYETYKSVIEKTGIKEDIQPEVYFEFYHENFKPPVGDLFYGLK